MSKKYVGALQAEHRVEIDKIAARLRRSLPELDALVKDRSADPRDRAAAQRLHAEILDAQNRDPAEMRRRRHRPPQPSPKLE